MKILKFIAAAAIVAALTACGGGGGSGSPTPPPTPTATYSLDSTATALTIQADQSFAQATETWDTTNAGAITLRDSAGNVVGSGPKGSATVNVPVGVTTYTLYDGTNAVKSVTITGTCVSGTNPNGAGVCKAPVVATWWPPANITAIGTKVSDPVRLGSDVVRIGDAAWQKAVTDGQVKLLDTGLVHTGFNTRPVLWAFYTAPTSGTFCTRAIYRDTGLAVGAETSASFEFADGNCNSNNVVWAQGTTKGVVRFFSDLGACYEISWVASTQQYSDDKITCPN